MMFEIEIADEAAEHIAWHAKNSKPQINGRIDRLIEELAEHPFDGIGKPEPLKGDQAGKWSRRINKKHRLVYIVENGRVKIASAKEHYE